MTLSHIANAICSKSVSVKMDFRPGRAFSGAVSKKIRFLLVIPTETILFLVSRQHEVLSVQNVSFFGWTRSRYLGWRVNSFSKF